MNLRGRLTLAFLVLTLVPSTVVAVISLYRIAELNELWQSAGLEEQYRSSVIVARSSLERLRYDLEHAAGPLVSRWIDEPPSFEHDEGERLYVERFLRDVGFDFVQVYEPEDGGYRLVSEVLPEASVEELAEETETPDATRRSVDLSVELVDHDPSEGPLQSASGAFAYVRDIAGDRRVAVGYLLEPDFFTSVSEVQLGIAMIGQLTNYWRVRQTFSFVLIGAVLATTALLAFLAAWFLSRRLAGPVAELAARLDAMRERTSLASVPEPRHATPEVEALTRAFNALTDRLRITQAELLRTERVAGSAQVARHLAHEIKNPLNTLGFATRRLERRLDLLPDEERAVAGESLEAMRKEFEVLREMADSFAEIGRMTDPLEREPVDLNALARSVRALHAEGPVDFRLDLTEDLPSLSGDEKALRRLLSNLVKNAVEAQGERGAVTIRTGRRASSVVLEVEDEGPGLTEEARARAFEPGFSTKPGGSGVGLFLARAIVEQHGGRISLDAGEPRGAVVRVEIRVSGERRTAA